jgi:predicted aminopeptidase
MLLDGFVWLRPMGVPAWRSLCAAALCLTMSGCGTLYLAQAGAGQWRVLHARRPVASVLADPRTPPQLRSRLEEVSAARDFAVRELHLPDNRSYRTYADIGRRYVVWNVVATPEFSVEPRRWCFPIAGCVSYRGYFHESAAQRFAARLARQGFDVAVEGVAAYSTLGKLADPVLSSMLRYADAALVGIVFHELAHQLLYVRDDSEFNEAFATTVEQTGLRRWLLARGRDAELQQVLEDDAEERAFVQLFAAARAQLARLYASALTIEQKRMRKAGILAELTRNARALQQQQGNLDYEEWLRAGLNNAYLASVATYYDCVPGFERLLAAQDGDLLRFYAAARELARRPRSERHAQLCRSPVTSAQRNQDDGLAAANFQHEGRGAPRTLAQLLQ